MIMTVEELRQYIDTDEEDTALEAWLRALTLSIHGHTNNNFVRVLEENNGEYPMDVKMGAVNLRRWEEKHREKVGVQTETISRHSVTYFAMDGDNADLGYPVSLLGFLQPYMRARFGRGLEK